MLQVEATGVNQPNSVLLGACMTSLHHVVDLGEILLQEISARETSETASFTVDISPEGFMLAPIPLQVQALLCENVWEPDAPNRRK
jgi:hypothetical protein